ncbi:hypothetical protein [Streptomyces sp. DW26H14]|uniref:hypothetical protein n=1 Tax=Streptomyces sp. DW26H14 TaxID=3435395 RepID=UPI00403D8C9C
MPLRRKAPLTLTSWLTTATPDPDALLDAWAQGGAGEVHAGVAFDVVRVDLFLTIRTMRVMRAAEHMSGPVLLCGEVRSAWWVLPRGTADRWRTDPPPGACGDGVKLLASGARLLVPRPGHYADGRTWMTSGDGARGTAPDVLGDALRIARASGAAPAPC